MAAVISQDERAISILNGIDARKKYDEGLTRPVKKVFSYLSLLGRLDGFVDGNGEQTQEIDTEIRGKGKNDEPSVLNALLAGIMERHQIGGGFFEYPRIFLVGPNQITKSPAKHDQMPYLRDVDRIMWVGSYTTLPYSGTRYFYLGYVDLWNEDYASPSEVKITQGYFYFYPRRTGLGFPFEEDRDKVVKNIVRDGGQWKLAQMGDTRVVMTGDKSGTESPLDQVLTLGWIAQILARERVLPGDFDDIRRKAQEEATMNAMLATAMIDTVVVVIGTLVYKYVWEGISPRELVREDSWWFWWWSHYYLITESWFQARESDWAYRYFFGTGDRDSGESSSSSSSSSYSSHLDGMWGWWEWTERNYFSHRPSPSRPANS